MANDTHIEKATAITKDLIAPKGKSVIIVGRTWPALFLDKGYAEAFAHELRTDICTVVAKHLEPAKPKSDRQRKYYGCNHCGSFDVVALKSCCGDPEGIRNDYQCNTCGGVYGCCKSGRTHINASDWNDEHDEPRPRANLAKVKIMRALAEAEEKTGVDFRDNETVIVALLAAAAESYAEALKKRADDLEARFTAVQKALNG